MTEAQRDARGRKITCPLWFMAEIPMHKRQETKKQKFDNMYTSRMWKIPRKTESFSEMAQTISNDKRKLGMAEKVTYGELPDKVQQTVADLSPCFLVNTFLETYSSWDREGDTLADGDFLYKCLLQKDNIPAFKAFPVSAVS